MVWKATDMKGRFEDCQGMSPDQRLAGEGLQWKMNVVELPGGGTWSSAEVTCSMESFCGLFQGHTQLHLDPFSNICCLFLLI